MADLYRRLIERAAARPEATALVHHRGRAGADVITYGALAEEARRFAAYLATAGGRAEIVPLYLSRSAACVAAMFGALGAGKAFAVLNKKLRAAQVAGVLEATGAEVALIDGAGALALGQALGTEEALSRPRWLLVREKGFLGPHQKAVDRLATAADVRDWAKVAPAPEAAPADLPPERIGCCLFTSGSTGAPKGVLIAQDDLHGRAVAEIEWFGLTERDVLLSILPFSFDVGLNQLLSGLASGCRLVLLDSWLPADILAAAAEHAVTGISAVPTIWSDMMAAGLGFRTDAEHAALRYLTVSGGDLLPGQLAALPALAPGAGIIKTYGQTEAFRAASLLPDQFAARPTSVGRPFLGTHVHVVREDGTPCDPGEEGEIVHSGLGVMRGYLDGEDPQRKLRANPFRGPGDPSPLAVFTGDLGHRDAEGFLYLHGRRDAMLKVAGNRVYPREVTAEMLRSPAVADAETVGVKDADGQTVLFAFAAAAAGQAIDPSRLRAELARRLPSYMVPRQVAVLPRLPRTASGKPDLGALRERAAALLARG